MTAASSEASKDQTTLSAFNKLILLLFAALCVFGFVYGNIHSEDFRIRYPRFAPWLWNLYLTCPLASLVGIAAVWFQRRWGFGLLLVLSALTLAIELYAMGFSVNTLRIPLGIALIWFAIQPAWKNFR